MAISVNGCVSRSVRDSAAWLAAMEASGANQQFEPVGLVEAANTQRLRIAVCIPDFRGRQPEADVRTAIEHVAELCRSLGHTVSEQAQLRGGEQFARDFVFIWSADAAQSVQSARAFAGADVDPTTILEPLTLQLAQQFMEQGGPGHLPEAFAGLRQFEAQYDAMFENIDVLLTPVLSKPPLPLGEIAPTSGLEGFERVLDYVGYTPIQNVAGAPAMSVPLTWSPGGLPIGSHFSAAKGRERMLLELAYELETASPWADRRPGVNAG